MVTVWYYKEHNLKYASRNRYRNLSEFSPANADTYKKVLYGDGSQMTLKTSFENICDYILIQDDKHGNSRWFVMAYSFLNGSQVELQLQRDVIGEFGVEDCFGKIERGVTDSFLKYRKELSLNEILKKRQYLMPDTNTFGNYTVSTKENSMWGIMYFAKPTELDPITGKPYPDQVNINIPAFEPNYVNYPLIADGAQFFVQNESNTYVSCVCKIGGYYHKVKVTFNFTGSWSYDIQISTDDVRGNATFNIDTTPSIANYGVVTHHDFLFKLFNNIASQMVQDTTANDGLVFPTMPVLPYETVNYDGVIVKDGSDYYSYSASYSENQANGVSIPYLFMSWAAENYINTSYSVKTATSNMLNVTVSTFEEGVDDRLLVISQIIYDEKTYTRTKLSNGESGALVLDIVPQLVDEPYSVLVFPLYNVTIEGNAKTYNIEKSRAFMIFNTVIQYLSGENAYLVDAQIYPYCPILTDVASEIAGYPFFKIQSNTYNHKCSVQLLPYIDIKKEYICRTYSLVSPEQSSKFDFNFYDYFNNVSSEVNGINYYTAEITVKTALKPYAIIASAVLTPTLNSLKGKTYASDMRGSQPSSNGFEVSLSSNAFQTYKRQNSNYQQIFALQQQELSISHETERVNEVTAVVTNTITNTAMGALAGYSMAGGSKIAGAVAGTAGGVAAGAATGIAGAIQIEQNDKLREFEAYQQQQNFDFKIGTVKNLPNSVNRISSFNEILLQDFWFVVETYECSDFEIELVENFIDKFGYGLGCYGLYVNFIKDGTFIRGTLITSSFSPVLAVIAARELGKGVYIHE